MNFSRKILASLLSAGLLLGSNSLVAHAGETEDIKAIKSNLEKRTPPLLAKSIKLSPLTGIYEVYANGNIFYVDKTVSYVMLNDSLPLKNAIEIKKGNGAYKFAVFSDPDCPFCKTLEQGLDKMGISDYTAYVFLFPLKELHPDAVVKSESIWCAKDKSEAWLNWMVKGTAPAKANCENPILANEKLADELGVAGTPTIYLNTGKQTQAPQELVAAMKDKK
jgi:thiol:disulfide interchange protein DsbC